MATSHNSHAPLNRRDILKGLSLAPALLHTWPLLGEGFSAAPASAVASLPESLPFVEQRLTPHYPARSPLEDVLRLVPAGSDGYATERYALEIQAELNRWSELFRRSDFAALGASLHPSFQASSFVAARETPLRHGGTVETRRLTFSEELKSGSAPFLKEIPAWLGKSSKVERADFEIIDIRETSAAPAAVQLTLRYDILTQSPADSNVQRQQRIGTWKMDWSHEPPSTWMIRRWQAVEESVSTAHGPVFEDVTDSAFHGVESYQKQLQFGSDHWRSALDGACGIDIYGNNGVAAGDFDNDGHDDLYVSQPAGLPNRLYRNRGDGTFEDVTEKAGVGVLDNTSCALFADFRNSGLQDLLVVCGSGPLLFVNQGDGTFRLRKDAFRFAKTPQGTFTHAAVADYDRDGRLDIYLCLYSYYLGLDQYHYPIPYFDARNGPPNFLLHNEGDGSFADRTEEAGLNVDNDRYSFACAWSESPSRNAPDLYVVNDFGRNVLYRNRGNGTFESVSTTSHVEDVGAGMSAAWADVNNDGEPDLYTADMWSAAGQRVSDQDQFHAEAPAEIRELYRQHASGNALYEGTGHGHFRNATAQAKVGMGRWAWCSDFWDFDHDGFADLYVTNGYITALGSPDRSGDLGSFFWRQVVGKSPNDSTPSLAYEHGWNALNELIRSDRSWSGSERNVLFANNHDGTFSDISGVAGMDFLEDGRSFALADFDGDGRLEIAIKNRNAPQLRIIRNAMDSIGDSIAFRLKGTKSNRDGIGTAVMIEVGDLHQTKYLQAGSGFLAQHTKELFFGLGKGSDGVKVSVRWPNGLTQHFENLPRNHRVLLTEGTTEFKAEPFVSKNTLHASPETKPQRNESSATENIETWLINPLQAPAFSLPDVTGKQITLASTNGSFTLLQFWSSAAPASHTTLQALQKHSGALTARQVVVLGLNLDAPEDTGKARTFLAAQRFTYPMLMATEEVAGIYNIIYRYLFDRRRDLPIPCSFLLDRHGMIVKLYQGPVAPERVLSDVAEIPETPAARIQKALPFAGTVHLSDFQRNDFTYGVAMFQHGYLQQAAESFQQVVAAHPGDAEAYYNLGTLHLRQNNFAQARKDLETTLQLRSDYPEAWNNLGMMAAQEGRADEAIRNFQESLRLRPGYAVALLNLGNIYRRQGDATKALDALTKALALQPDDPEANYSLGMFYAQQSQLDSADAYLRKAIAMRPDYPEALNNLGVLFVRKQDYENAALQFQTCIRLAPTFEQSYFNLARLYMLQHDKARAKAVLEDLIRIKPDNAAGRQALQAIDANP